MTVPSPVEGILVVRKGAGPSSNALLQKVRRLLGRCKAGHAGTLDPEAEGVLVVCLGRATKLVPFLAPLDKEYRGRVRFGEETDTYDAAGTVVATAPAGHLSPGLIREKMSELTGEQSQEPPMFSAVKIAGKRLYALARRGEEVERPRRSVQVMEFSLLSWESPEGEFKVRCSGGTYVRSLCRDLGRLCGSAAHMAALTRTAVGPFRLGAALSLEQIAAAVDKGRDLPLVAPSEALGHMPVLPLTGEEVESLRHGRRILPPGEVAEDLDPGENLRLVDGTGRLIALVRYEGTGRPMPILRVLA